MPTAGKLVAAVLFGALAWYTSILVIGFMEVGTAPPSYALVNAVIGAAMGWIVAGKRARGTWMNAVSYGITATLALIFWWLFLHSFYDMIQNALRGLYGSDATLAVVAVFGLMLEHAMYMNNSTVITTFLAGAVVCGLITEWFARRFN